MFDLDLWREIFQSINKNRTRSLLSGFTVAFAIMLFTILFGIANGLENTFRSLFLKTADNSISIRTGTTSKPYKGLQVDRGVLFHNPDIDYLKDEYKDKIEYISSKVSRSFQVKSKDEKGSYTLVGVYPDYQYIEKIEIDDGRFINIKDFKNKEKVVVIGKLVENDLFFKTSAVGKYLNMEGILYRVIGVFTNGGDDNQERLIYTSVSTLQQIYIGTDEFSELILTYNPNMSVDNALAFGNTLTKDLKKKYNVSPDDQRAIRVDNKALATKGIETMSSGLGVLIFIIGFGTLIAGIVGISNIMIFIVKERTKEIGIRKALGAQPKSIVSIIIIESILITAIAGYVGLLIGVGVLKWGGPSLKQYFITDPSVNTSIVISATIVLIAAGAIAGFLPAKKASQIKPIIALRNG